MLRFLFFKDGHTFCFTQIMAMNGRGKWKNGLAQNESFLILTVSNDQSQKPQYLQFLTQILMERWSALGRVAPSPAVLGPIPSDKTARSISVLWAILLNGPLIKKSTFIRDCAMSCVLARSGQINSVLPISLLLPVVSWSLNHKIKGHPSWRKLNDRQSYPTHQGSTTIIQGPKVKILAGKYYSGSY